MHHKTTEHTNNTALDNAANDSESVDATGSERAVLVGLSSPVFQDDQQADEDTLAELESLLETAGGICIAQSLQHRQSPNPRTLIGKGKLAELKELCQAHDIDLVVFDNELSPSQTRNLEKELECRVIDRSVLILDIFAARAQTHEGRLQVELAQYRYTLPRLSGKGTSMSQTGAAQSGGIGIGTRGPGETQLETDRRHIRRHIHQLEAALRRVREIRSRQRIQRQKNEMPTIALIGYTNAGKSSLLNALTNAKVVARDRLFETLDPITRKLPLSDGATALLTDTVGFIHKLPHHLIEAFKATLEELTYADLLLHVIDVSHADWHKQAEVVEKLLEQLGAAETSTFRVYNKIDLANAIPPPNDGMAISVLTGKGLDDLLTHVSKQLNADRRETQFCLPYDRADFLDVLYKDGQVLSITYEDDCIIVKAVCGERLRKQLNNYIK
ncbi:MAG: GTPase HflX [Oscillospiraceae bacterium]|nr:GTPase HflX [Oscillospiraceae bacterium]